MAFHRQKKTNPINTAGGIISNPADFLCAVEGSFIKESSGKGAFINDASGEEASLNSPSNESYHLVPERSHVLQSVGHATCAMFGGHNNCTPVAMFNLLYYYRNLSQLHSFSNSEQVPQSTIEPELSSTINPPISDIALYDKLAAIASSFNFDYEKSQGLSVFYNRRFVNAVWNAYGYPYQSKSHYIWTKKRAITAIDSNHPFLFSIATGRYYDHTVMVYGYETYQNASTGAEYQFLVIADGWSTEPRYLAWTNTKSFYIACMTLVSLPGLKQI